MDWSEQIRAGYDAVSYAYRADTAERGHYAAWIDHLNRTLGGPSRIVDLGCGCGVPVAQDLAAAGHAVIGVDISPIQIQRARQLVPTGVFRCGDLASMTFPDASFDAAVFLYSIIHMPLTQQPAILQKVARWLAPGGLLIMTAGHHAWTGSEERWLGTDATMWWSHADSATYRNWLETAGFTIDDEADVPEGQSLHSFFWAHRESISQAAPVRDDDGLRCGRMEEERKMADPLENARPLLRWTGVCIDCADSDELATFYGRLLGREVTRRDGAGWIGMRDPAGGMDLLFQAEQRYRAPLWPEQPSGQDKMLHFEIQVDDLDAAVAYATEIGARLADYQPQDGVRVMLDPAGHPFCLYLD